MKDLKTIRNEIDQIDQGLVKLFHQRMELSKAVAKEKINSGQKIENKSREDEILEKVDLSSPENLKPYSKALYQVLFFLSKAYQVDLISANPATGAKIQEALDQLDFDEIKRLINSD